MKQFAFLIAVLWLVLVLTITACTSVPQRLDPEQFYRRDLPFCVDNLGCFEGVTVLPKRSSYTFEIEPKGGADIDLLLVTTCHREDSFEKTDTGWWIFKNKKRFKYFYSPVPGIEDTGMCPLRINTYEKEKGRHSWSLIFFEDPKFEMNAAVTCNGKVMTFNGVSACQSKVGLIQRISFGRPVQWGTPPEGCAAPKYVKTGLYELEFKRGECVHVIRDAQDRFHQFGTVGYEGVLIREE